jgi:Kdo2-lipid IVA lauroyltransferase/acyltransferase
MTTAADLSLRPFWRPRFWPMWLLWLALHGVARLPFRWQRAIGRGLGPVVGRLKRRERRTAAINLAACFPELDPVARETLLTQHFEAIGMSFVEMAIGWFAPLSRLVELIEVRGREHLEAAQATGRGVLLVSAHLTTLETGFAILQTLSDRISCMYRPQRNPMMDVMIRRGRSRFAREQIPRDNVRALIKALRSGRIVAYMPDQTYLGNQSAVLPFFGVPAVTNVATSKLARISDAIVLPYFFRRLPGHAGYVVDIGPPVDDVPSDDAVGDTRRLVTLLEDYIRLAPEQYLWLYKKFKARPAPLPDLYRR